MNTLFIHSSKLDVEAKKATKFAEEIADDEKEKHFDECLVCFLAFEEADNGKEEEVSAKLIAEVKDVAKQVGAETVVLYPYVHLLFGKKPSAPETAKKIIEVSEKELNGSGLKAEHSPFGYYKAFGIECKGHPLSELSREIIAGRDEEVSKALVAENKLVSHWHILDTKGELHKLVLKEDKIEGFDFGKHKNLEKFARYEMAKSRVAEQEPPHVALMKKLEIADYEPGSDPGNLRYPPKGKMIKALLEDWTTQKVHEYGGMEIEAPIMYDYNHPSLKKYLDRFPARQYTIMTPNKKVFLRFAACFGQFLMLHDAVLSYRHFPLKLYEMTRYSFRVEKRGELTGLRRLRAFTMPDCHAFCTDMKQAIEQYRERFEVAQEVVKGCGLNTPEDFELALRIVKPFWEENMDFIKDMVKKYKKPALVEMWDSQFFYFVLKYELNFVDALGKASALSTDQIDVENAERYDLKFADKDGNNKHPLILHMSPSGAIERVIYALLEKAHMESEKGKNPVLPLWLSPTQVRLCPVNDELNKHCEKIADEISKEKVRVDVDDRSESIGKKVRGAELEWVPYIVVVGEKEKKSGKLAVRDRVSGKVKEMKVKDLVKLIQKEAGDKPFRMLPVPRKLTERPTFVA